MRNWHPIATAPLDCDLWLSVIESREVYELAVEHVAPRQLVKHALEPPRPIAVARNQPPTNGVGRSPEAVELELEKLVAMVERLDSWDRVY